MKILENPNPMSTHILVCEKCKCKFEFTSIDIIKDSWGDSNGRMGGGTHRWSTTKYIKCPNCGEKIILSKQSGYGSSMIGDHHITEDYHINNLVL